MADIQKAFPELTRDPFGNCFAKGGMELRDWFAGQAMSGMLRFTPRELKTWNEMEEWAQSLCVARLAYRLADEMMLAREGNQSA